MMWLYAVTCVVTLSAPVAMATCDACFPGCPITNSLDPLSYNTHLTGYCPNSSYTLKLSSIRVASSDGTDHKFTVTTTDRNGFADFRRGSSSYAYYSDLSTGLVSDRSTESTCFQRSTTRTLSAGDDLYVIIACVNYLFDCHLRARMDFTCLLILDRVDECKEVSCGSHGICHKGRCLCDAGYQGVRCEILMSVMTSSVFVALVGMECAFVIEDTADYNVKLLTDAMAAIAVYMVCVVLECAFVIMLTKVTRARYRVARLLRQTPTLLSSLALQQELLYW